MASFQRQLKRQARSTRLKIVKEMRKDLLYILKPKPKFWPKRIWMWLLKKLLNLKPEQINAIKNI